MTSALGGWSQALLLSFLNVVLPLCRLVMTSACARACPWGKLGEFVRDAMAARGYEILLCRNCNRDRGPRLVAYGRLGLSVYGGARVAYPRQPGSLDESQNRRIAGRGLATWAAASLV